MVKTKANQELTKMRKTGITITPIHHAVSATMQPRITTQGLDRIIGNVILENGATPSFEGLYGFPVTACISINSVIVHGILGDAVLCNRGVVLIDTGACYQGYHGDPAWTYGVGKLSERDQRLMRVSEESLYEGLRIARMRNHLTDIPHAVGEYVFTYGYSIPRDCAGHGIGTSVRRNSAVPNLGPAGCGTLLQEGMTLAVESVIHASKSRTRILKDGWGVVTRDGSKAARFEHAIVTINRGYEILTILNKGERPGNG